jgi:hypothetical protein
VKILLRRYEKDWTPSENSNEFIESLGLLFIFPSELFTFERRGV